MGIKKLFDKIKKNHWLMMALCCIVPLIIAGVLYYFNFKTYALLAIMLLCPIMHYFMMRDMHKNHQNKNLKNKESCH